MTSTAKIGGASLLLSLMLTVPCLAQNGARVCTSGTIGGKCIDTIIANASSTNSRLLVFGGNRSIPPVPPSVEHIIDDPLRKNSTLQPQHGINGTTGFSGAGSWNFIYGRWN